MKKIFIFILLTVFIISLNSLEPGDYVQGAPVVAKVILPVYVTAQMVSDSDTIIPGAIGLGLFSLPGSFLLYNIITENPVGTTFWRNVTIYSDTAAGLAILGSGIYLLAGFGNDPTGWDPLVAGIYIAMSALVFKAVGIDKNPYSFEY